MKDIEMGGACGVRRTNAYVLLVVKPKEMKMLGRAGPR
jgi:hypothetical protein